MRQQKSFILKLWNDSHDESLWRASLEDIFSKEKSQFATMTDLIERLEQLLEPFTDDEIAKLSQS